MIAEPALLVRLSCVCGIEVETYRHTLTPPNMVHPTVPKIFIVSNAEPVNREPPRRRAARTAADRRWPPAHAVVPSPRLAHRQELPGPAAGHLPVPRGQPGAEGTVPDAVRRRDRRLLHAAARVEGPGGHAGWNPCRVQRLARVRRCARRHAGTPARRPVRSARWNSRSASRSPAFMR